MTQQNTAVEVVGKNLALLENMVSQCQDQLAVNLQGQIDTDKFRFVALELIRGTPGLLKCSQTPEGRLSIVKAVTEASELGLMLTKHLGHGYLVPYRNGYLSERAREEVFECQFQIGYRGYLFMIREADSEIQTVYARIVWPEEPFALDEDQHRILHTPSPESGQIQVNQQTGETGGYRGAYAKVVYKNGAQDFEWMPWHEIEKIRRFSKAKSEDTPWRKWPEEMIKKTPMRRLCKRLNLTPERLAGVVRDEYRALGVEDARTSASAMPMPRRRSEIAATPEQSNSAPGPTPFSPGHEATPPTSPTDGDADKHASAQPPKCKKCKVDCLLKPAGIRNGKPYPPFWSCPNYKDCKFKPIKAQDWYEQQQAGKKEEPQPPAEAEDPQEGSVKCTELFHGIVSRSGRSHDTLLAWLTTRLYGKAGTELQEKDDAAAIVLLEKLAAKPHSDIRQELAEYEPGAKKGFPA